MSDVVVFGKCDECGCIIAPSDNPVRPLGSMGGVRFENGETIRTCEVRCPSCMHLVNIDIPEGVAAADVFGEATPIPPIENMETGGGGDE